MRMTLVLLLVFNVTVAVLAGGAQQEEKTGITESKKIEPITLHHWGHTHPPMNDFVAKVVVPDYERENPNIRVIFETQGAGGQFDQKLLTALISKTGPDLFAMNDTNLPAYVSRGFLLPIDPSAFGASSQSALESMFIDNALDGFKADGVLYGVPMEFNTFSLFYRSDHFRETGIDPNRPPKTWKEVGEAGKKLTKRNNVGAMTRAGFQWAWKNPNTYIKHFPPLAWQAGAELFDLNNPRGLVAVNTFASFVHEYKCSDPSFQLSQWEDFWNGLCSMVVSGPWFAGYQNNYPAVKYLDQWMTSRLPQLEGTSTPTTYLYGWPWVVSADSAHKRESWEYINYMSKRQKDWFFKVQYVQPRKGWVDDEVKRAAPWLEPVFLADMEIGRFFPPHVKFFEIRKALSALLERTAMEAMPSTKALEMYETEINTVLAK